MKKTISVIATVVLTLFILNSCTKNEWVRNYGGSETIKLKPNEKFLNMTWKENNMWVITIDTLTNVGHAREYSEHGIYNGEVTFTTK